MKKSKAIWIAALLSAIVAVYYVKDNYNIYHDSLELVNINSMIFNYLPVFGIIVSILISTILGFDYSYGSTKNKIIAGNNTYKELYMDDSYAFLAPDNYGADTVDEIEVSFKTQLEQASKEFDKICRDIKNKFVWACQETNQLDLINKTSGWRIRDFVAEADYQANKYIQWKSNYTEEEVPYNRAYAMWQRVVNYGNSILTDDMLCTTEHMSKYDVM